MTNETPQPIETAPKNGTTILSNLGLVIYINPKSWGSPVKKGWANVDSYNGNVFDDSDYGILYCSPTKWLPVPKWIIET
jgi:hypothetical protein